MKALGSPVFSRLGYTPVYVLSMFLCYNEGKCRMRVVHTHVYELTDWSKIVVLYEIQIYNATGMCDMNILK